MGERNDRPPCGRTGRRGALLGVVAATTLIAGTASDRLAEGIGVSVAAAALAWTVSERR